MDMERTEKIVERLPGFYRAREKTSFLYFFVRGFAKAISEQQKDLNHILRSHWVDTANGVDLDLLAALFAIKRKRDESDDALRLRVKSTLVNYRGGGTVEAVKSQVAAYLAIPKEEVILIENPEVPMLLEKNVRSGDSWSMSSASISNEDLMISITIEEGEARDPTLVNEEFNFMLRYKGTLKKGETLEIGKGSAKLDGVPVSPERFIEGAATNMKPVISRKNSNWLYRETLSDTIARFNQAKFNESVFFKFVPHTTIRFHWTARLLAAFEIKVPLGVLKKNHIKREDLEELVNAIKAAGVRVLITVVD
jgi:hypothetical protein